MWMPWPALTVCLSHALKIYNAFPRKQTIQQWLIATRKEKWWKMGSKIHIIVLPSTLHPVACGLRLKNRNLVVLKRTSHMKADKPSYLTDAWLPDDVELFEDKGVGLSANVLLDDGNGSVCEWNCWVISLLAPLVESLCIVWLCFREDSLDTAWLDTLGGGAGTGFDFPAGNRSWRLLMQLVIEGGNT